MRRAIAIAAGQSKRSGRVSMWKPSLVVSNGCVKVVLNGGKNVLNQMSSFEFRGEHRAVERAEKRIKELEDLVLSQARRIAEMEAKYDPKQEQCDACR